MKPLECYRILGLRPGAGLVEVHAAYKQIVLDHHPDRTAGDAESLRVFCEATEAYSILKASLRGSGGNGRLAEGCSRCGQVVELFNGAGRRKFCADCLLQWRRRLLPMPRLETIRCFAVMLLQGLALYCIVLSAVQADWRMGLAALTFVLASLLVLAYNVWSADVIER